MTKYEHRNISQNVCFRWYFLQPGEHFNLLIQINPCDFNVYDRNGDEIITKEEIITLFSDRQLADKLFNALDFTGKFNCFLHFFNRDTCIHQSCEKNKNDKARHQNGMRNSDSCEENATFLHVRSLHVIQFASSLSNSFYAPPFLQRLAVEDRQTISSL